MMLNIGGPNSTEEVAPFLERFFSDASIIRIPIPGLAKFIGKFIKI